MPGRPFSPCLLLLLLASCQATSRLSGQGALHASTSSAGTVEASGSATLTVRGPTIRLVRDRDQDRLEYEGTIHFAYDEARLEGEETFQVLRHFQQFLQQHPQVKVRIEGHTDSRGSEFHNEQLAQRRAQAIRQWLTQHGIEASRLDAIGRGEKGAEKIEDPACYNKLPKDTAPCEEGWARSRRAVFSVVAGAKSLDTSSPPPLPASSTTSTPSAPVPEERTRRSYLGGHLGLAETTRSPAQGRGFLGPDLGFWLSPRWSLGLSGDLALAPGLAPLGRALLQLEAHASTGPGPELWFGLGVGAGSIPPAGAPASATVALRLGIDWHPSAATRLGPFLETAHRSGDASWIGLGARMMLDFF